jgi:predicted nucleic acid-binding protein
MTAKVFVDTNALVYVYSLTETNKQKRALEVVDYLTAHSLGALSTQVLGEFFVTVTCKIRTPLTVE